MNVDNKTLQEMLKEVMPERYQEGDYTMRMIREEFGISDKAARDRLEVMVKAGLVRQLKGIGPTGRVTFLWRKVE